MDTGAQTAVGRARAPHVATPWKRGVEVARRDFGPALVGSVLPFALVVYLALRGGGYDRIVYSEVGIAVWWLVLLGALVGILPAVRISRAGWIAFVALAGFVAWTALGIAWSESAERSAAEAGRVAAYLGVFALALATQSRDGMRRTINAVAAAIVLVGLLALLSRLHPAWFPPNDVAQRLPEVGNRLGYPLDYWNGLAALMAIGIPLVLRAALHARHLVTQALAAAALPAMALTAFYTFSRGGALAIGIGMLTFFALHPRRMAMLPTLALSGAGAALLVGAATQRTPLQDDVLSDAARAQGDEMLAVVLVACAGVGLVQVAIGLAARHGLGPRPRLPRLTPRRIGAVAGVAVTVIVVLALVAGLPGELAGSDAGDTRVGSGSERFEDLGNADNRIRYWNSALDATASAPLTGIGAGTFEFWWARNGDLYSFARDAHSLVLETLAEVGIIGLLLIVAFIAAVLGAGVRRAWKSETGVRTSLAAAIASCVAFIVAAAVDWVWELPAVPVAFLLLAAAILGSTRIEHGRGGESGRPRAWLGARGALVAAAILALAAIAVPYLSTRFVRDSQSQLRAGELDSALGSAEKAAAVEPFSATASTQRALVLARSGELGRAVGAAREATREESTNHRTWLLLAGLEAERGHAAKAIDAYETAYDQNPHSVAFRQGGFLESFASRVKQE